MAYRPISVLNAADAEEISKHVRKALRTQFVAEDVSLDNEFPFSEFKGLDSDFGPAVALPLSLSDAPLPAGAIGSVTNHFLGSSGFGIAVSKEQTLFAELVNDVKVSIDNAPPEEFLGADYRASAGNISLAWKPGAIDFSGHVDLVTDSIFLPNHSIDFTQTFTVELDVPGSERRLER